MKTGDEYQCDRCGKTRVTKTDKQIGGGFHFIGELERNSRLYYKVLIDNLCPKCESKVEALLEKIEHPDHRAVSRQP